MYLNRPRLERSLLTGCQVGSTLACGFCGRSGHSECASLAMTKGRNGVRTIISKCPLRCIISRYKVANEGSTTTPCRNVPIFCRLCPVGGENSVVWRYNYVEHLSIFHQSYARPGTIVTPVQCILPYLVWKDVELTTAEQKKALIPDTHMFPSFNAYEPPTSDTASTGNKRAGAKRGGAPK
jgi:hypothetical protein